MSVFTEKELDYLQQQPLGRLATTSAGGQPHVIPTGFRIDPETGVIAIGGRAIEGQPERLYRRNIRANPQVAFVVDDLASLSPWTPRGITIRGQASVETEGGEGVGPGFSGTWVRIVPLFIASWGIEAAPYDPPLRRKVPTEPSS